MEEEPKDCFQAGLQIINSPFAQILFRERVIASKKLNLFILLILKDFAMVLWLLDPFIVSILFYLIEWALIKTALNFIVSY